MCGSDSSQSQSQSSTDKRLTAGGDLLAVQDSTVNTSGGSLYITSANAELAAKALDAATKLSSSTNDAALELATGSNKIAKEVADSQAAFVEVASGQKSAIYIVGGALVATVAGIYLFTRKKS